LSLEHADRGYVLERGRVVMSGRASELLTDPRVGQAYLGLGAASGTEAPIEAVTPERGAEGA
jgi:ABC-type glutathione transport system ATPase component